MKIKLPEWRKKKTVAHTWWAWRPVITEERQLVWLTTVTRKWEPPVTVATAPSGADVVDGPGRWIYHAIPRGPDTAYLSVVTHDHGTTAFIARDKQALNRDLVGWCDKYRAPDQGPFEDDEQAIADYFEDHPTDELIAVGPIELPTELQWR